PALGQAPTTATHTLSLHDALPIFGVRCSDEQPAHVLAGDSSRNAHPAAREPASLHLHGQAVVAVERLDPAAQLAQGLEQRRDGTDRKSTRLNSSHVKMSYAGVCLK